MHLVVTLLQPLHSMNGDLGRFHRQVLIFEPRVRDEQSLLRPAVQNRGKGHTALKVERD